tara:strand:+ start:471 stop:1193 length:723 start_codon:yes stop_codon:yes gene_type:complete
MKFNDIKALTFDTGGTILDWHTGFSTALKKLGENHEIEKDWPALANDLRRRSLKKMINLGQNSPPEYNFDGAHRSTLDEILEENDLTSISEDERRKVWWDAPHNFRCWPDFPVTLPKLKEKYICASFTLLSVRLITDTARVNRLNWDAVLSCEIYKKYKLLPEAYTNTASLLQLDPSECLMVACHNFDLDAARNVGFRTAFVKRPEEWGPEGPPDPIPNSHHDIIVDDFPTLAQALGVSV